MADNVKIQKDVQGNVSVRNNISLFRIENDLSSAAKTLKTRMQDSEPVSEKELKLLAMNSGR